MSVESLPIKSRDAWLGWRQQDITASTAACLLGDIHPYCTAYRLWAEKSGLLKRDDSDGKQLRRGRLLEPVALDVLRDDNPTWRVEANEVYLREPESRIGATLDARVWIPGREGFGAFQVKTAGEFAFNRKWKAEDGSLDVPDWVALQALVEASLSEATYAMVGVLDSSIELHVAEIPLKKALMPKMRRLVADFWRRVEQNDPYPPDYGKDAATIARIYADADTGEERDLRADKDVLGLIEQRDALCARETDGRAANRERAAIDARLIHLLGNAAFGRLPDGRFLSAPTTRRGEHVVKATSFRTVRVKSAKATGRASQTDSEGPF